MKASIKTGFEDRGGVVLRGVPGSWQLLAVDRHGAHSGSAEADLASMSTPSDRDAPVGPCRGGSGEADTVDPARDRTARPGHRS
jgi:hypothetical protein